MGAPRFDDIKAQSICLLLLNSEINKVSQVVDVAA
jgi:hypothetical protein